MAKPTITLQFTFLSAEDLRIDGRPLKKNAFAIVKTNDDDDDQSTSKSTAVDSDGGSYPRWNETIVVEFPRSRNQSFLTVEVRCKVGSRNNRVIGIARVPVTDFLGHLTPLGYLHFLSYRLRDPRGVKNGIVNFSVRVVNGGGGGAAEGRGDGYGCSVVARKKGGNYASSTYFASPSWTLPSSASAWTVPVARDRNGYGGGGVVTGVPVWGGACASRFI
ncbi:BON1-associated protein 2 [Linum perenne]